MDQFSQPSFIPKKSFTPVAPAPKSSLGILFVVSLIIFLASTAAYGAAFAYSSSIDQNIADQKATLARKRLNFDTETLDKLSKVDARLAAARDILSKHRTLAPLFELLDRYTLQSVRFRSFGFGGTNDSKPITIQMTGDADGYSSIALQSDSFSESGKLRNIVFSNLNLDATGRVIFSFSAELDQSVLSYRAYLQSLGGAASPTVEQAPGATQTDATSTTP